MHSRFFDLEYAAKKQPTWRDQFLAEIEAIAPWSALEAEIEPFNPKDDKRSPPAIGHRRMLRMYGTQQYFGLSDEGGEDVIYDDQAIRAFVGIDLARESAPNATLLPTPHSTKNRGSARAPEIHQTRKGKQWYVGMNAHLAVDAELGLLYSVLEAAANVSDMSQAHVLPHGNGPQFLSDAGSQDIEKRKANQHAPANWRMAMKQGKRKELQKYRMGERMEKLEQNKGSLLAKLKPPFQVVNNLFNHRNTRYRGQAKNTEQGRWCNKMSSIPAAPDFLTV